MIVRAKARCCKVDRTCARILFVVVLGFWEILEISCIIWRARAGLKGQPCSIEFSEQFNVQEKVGESGASSFKKRTLLEIRQNEPQNNQLVRYAVATDGGFIDKLCEI